MRWSTAYSTAVLSGALASSSAFLAPRHQRSNFAYSPSAYDGSTAQSSSSSSPLKVSNMGWDNDNFLDALSKGPEALDKANEQYNRLKRFGQNGHGDEDFDQALPSGSNTDERPDGVDEGYTKGAELSKDQIERIKRQNEDDTAGGGEMFKKLMERAQQGGSAKPPPHMAVLPPPPPPPPAMSETGPALPAGFENLSVEAQAALFRQLMLNPVQQPAAVVVQQFPPAPGPRPPATGQAAVAEDGRRIGRNRDADAIVNSSDVYFAQLKVDSTVRNLARYQGDYEKAEAVFADPAIKEIKLHVNPHMEEARRKEQEMLETAAEEMIRPENIFAKPKPVNLNDSGVSYKEKMQQRKSGKQWGGAADVVAPPKAFVWAPRVPEPVASTPQYEDLAAPSTPERHVDDLPKSNVAATPAAVVQPPSVVSPAVSVPGLSAPPFTVQPSPPVSNPYWPQGAATDDSLTKKTPEDMHRDVRNLMGLLLKHRGGPGFGSGRIQGTEIARFESLSAEILTALRAEALAMATASNQYVQEYQAPLVSAPGPVVVQRAASAGPGGAISQVPRIPAGERINSMLACIEGAIQMYKNSPPELQESVLVTLRAALLSAVNTCNEIVSVNEVQRYEAYRTAITDPRTRTAVPSTTPTQFYDVVPEARELPAPVAPPPPVPYAPEKSPFSNNAMPTYGGNDENAVFLESVYRKLQEASGDGRMGLRKDLGAADAEDLANDIARMRALLVNELNGDIPQAAIPATASPGSSSSKYQEMLAKARADKTGQ